MGSIFPFWITVCFHVYFLFKCTEDPKKKKKTLIVEVLTVQSWAVCTGRTWLRLLKHVPFTEIPIVIGGSLERFILFWFGGFKHDRLIMTWQGKSHSFIKMNVGSSRHSQLNAFLFCLTAKEKREVLIVFTFKQNFLRARPNKCKESISRKELFLLQFLIPQCFKIQTKAEKTPRSTCMDRRTPCCLQWQTNEVNLGGGFNIDFTLKCVEGSSRIKGESLPRGRKNNVRKSVKCVVSPLLEWVSVRLHPPPLYESCRCKTLVSSGLVSFPLFSGAWYSFCSTITTRVVNVRVSCQFIYPIECTLS